MDRFARIVLGFHGCTPEFAETLIRGEVAVRDWKPSRNPYDWLGEGIYFWEHAPERARTWARQGGVVGAVIQLGMCLDLTDVRYTALLASEFEILSRMHEREGRRLPRNRGKRRDLDCFVINELIASAGDRGARRFQTVRGPFLEGEAAFPGSSIFRESHIPIAVRDLNCILGIFRPNLK